MANTLKGKQAGTEIVKTTELTAHVELTTTAHGGLLPATSFSGLVKITVGTTPPVDPSVGDLWIDTN